MSMFTEQEKGKWSYMLIAAVASLAVAALVSLFSANSTRGLQDGVNRKNGQTTGTYTQFNEATMRFIN